MKNQVTVTADDAGNVIIKSERNPDYGHLRVEQTRMVIDDNGFARKRKLSALIPGTVEDLQGFGWSAGEEVEGKILIKESLTPFNTKDPERDYKVAGSSGIVCTGVDAETGEVKPIYRKHLFTFSTGAEDSTIEHVNGEEIQAAYAEAKSEKALKPNDDFNL
jgi:hypothetical protein